MKKILQVTSKLFRGGAEAFIMNVYRNIDRERFQFDFLVFRSPREYYEDEIESLGGHVYRVPIMEGANVLRRRSMLDSFFAEHYDYDAVHCHMEALGNDCLASAEKHGIECRLSHSHIADFDHNPRGLIKRILGRRFGDHATDRFACSEWAGRYMYGEKSFAVIKNGIDTVRFAYDLTKRISFRSRIGATEQECLLGHVGRFELVKNHEFLIDTFAALVGCGFKGRLVLAGDGSLRESMENHAKDVGVGNRVVFLGAFDDMSSFYSGIDLFVMPSLSEGLPFSAIEAQCAGVPCVLSNAISEECRVAGNVGFLSLGLGAEAWAKTLASMLSGTDARSDGSAAVRTAGYDIKDVAAQLEAYYGGAR